MNGIHSPSFLTLCVLKKSLQNSYIFSRVTSLFIGKSSLFSIKKGISISLHPLIASFHRPRFIRPFLKNVMFPSQTPILTAGWNFHPLTFRVSQICIWWYSTLVASETTICSVSASYLNFIHVDYFYTFMLYIKIEVLFIKLLFFNILIGFFTEEDESVRYINKNK